MGIPKTKLPLLSCSLQEQVSDSPVTTEGLQDDQLASIMSKHVKQVSPGLSLTPFNRAHHPLRNVN